MRFQFVIARPIAPAPDLGGIEQAVVHLTVALRRRGHRIWVTVPGAALDGAAEVTVAVNDARLLAGTAGLKVVWFHNEVSVWREARRGRLPAFWRHLPVAVFCGRVQRASMQGGWLLPFRRRVVIGHGLPDAVLGAEPAAAAPGPHAVFLSQGYRGLAGVIGLWRRLVAPSVAAARLTAYQDSPWPWLALAAGEASIRIVPRVANAAVPGVLRGARVVLAPGHAAETFCLVAAEAAAMGVPVVTYGHGALRERVVDGQTGFICVDEWAFAARVVALLTDDALWQRMHLRCLATRAGASWGGVAAHWESLGMTDGAAART